MAMNINNSAALNNRIRQRHLSELRNQPAAVDPRDAARNASSTGLASFRSGQARQAPGPGKSLARRLTQARKGSGASGSSALDDDDDDEEHIQAVSKKVMSNLRDGSEQSLEDMLSPYDPLQRHLLLGSVREELKKTPDDPKRQIMDAKLGAMLAELDKKHGPQIRAGQQDGDTLSRVLAQLGQAGDFKSMQSLRRACGAADGAALTPEALFDTLRKTAASSGKPFGALMEQVHSGMAGGLQDRKLQGRRLCMSLADTSAVRLVQSSMAQAKSLNSALSAQAELTPRGSQEDTAAWLMKLSQQRAGQAATMLDQVAHTAHIDQRRRARGYAVLRDSVRQTPDRLWQGPMTRGTLIEELTACTVGSYQALPSGPSAADQREAEWRSSLQRAGG
ncbi:hypothetical protein [Janthinobacterium agaricidamnosum]|uniref:Uncharacterized protein n=1 Tax=Janthinobacterium agaricidamnosum NBRC 102515 = DSM 9628 TaxID=1349767 RepID=W0V4U9_9BURK|nr:hypothetical protein [Janthinobacterium agaricidamnosum]CDG82297.1 hypothetical protein GJA_1659 [Janthinobacterium agaricidamnosum NBRC 102515 = DSM 9628]